MKRSKKRFKSETEIVAAIDSNKAHAIRKLKEAENCDKIAEGIFRSGDLSQVENANFWKHNADVLRVSRARNETKAKSLGLRLAEFQTLQLPGINDGDASVPGV